MIRVQNVVKKFGDFTAVDDISFEVQTGEIFAFLGPNGAGKTTTIKMLTTLLQPTSGTLEINGFNPAAQQEEVRKQFGIVFQDPAWTRISRPGRTWSSTVCSTACRERFAASARKCCSSSSTSGSGARRW